MSGRRRAIVLVHGMGGNHWSPFARRFFARSELAAHHRLLVPVLPAFRSIERRSAALGGQIDDWLRRTFTDDDGRPVQVHLIGHSMGGLDCRLLVHRLAPQSRWRPASLTTIATPHRGSSFADLCCALPGLRQLSGTALFAAGRDVTQQHMRAEFNVHCTDRPDCRYFSVAARVPAMSRLHPLYPSWRYITDAEGDNDGLVSTHSATWGTLLDTVDRVDHMAQLGWSLPNKEPSAALIFRLIEANLKQINDQVD